MFITSPVFHDRTDVPTRHTCNGENISPALEFRDLPAGTKSLVLIVEDVDATPDPWIHWLVFNIPPTTASVSAGHIPEGSTEGIANGGTHGYEGPCPKYFSGTHHYHFRLFALDTVLDLPATADKTQVAASMQDHLIDSATLVGLCEGTKAEA
ncbi:phospholipid-binding protein, PBP family [Nitrosospira sp. Nsp11]|uniref:YbhB/YbcL family Raf kinase inhibitor-like protein n=1 Tax=Nitrosospira sp. Nsp11 TaxID=1855338 RepID=UPI0009195460|nr:YbhB/YbcL family Raf kinase inhibitor-like protein [Nitrosospira sp. Nsp11]SHL74806.1 phospholipid-binding protein, PBP family [Nitrosospira sp. Nsp11]